MGNFVLLKTKPIYVFIILFLTTLDSWLKPGVFFYFYSFIHLFLSRLPVERGASGASAAAQTSASCRAAEAGDPPPPPGPLCSSLLTLFWKKPEREEPHEPSFVR